MTLGKLSSSDLQDRSSQIFFNDQIFNMELIVPLPVWFVDPQLSLETAHDDLVFLVIFIVNVCDTD